MIGLGIRKVFRSRWNALWWAGGVMLTAYCSVPRADAPAPGTKQQASSAATSSAPADQEDDRWSAKARMLR